jgi:hypothetical protein
VVGLEQKFIDQTTFFPLIELLGTEMLLEEFSYSIFPIGEKPQCVEGCQSIGLRTFNKFKLSEHSNRGSVFRVWIVRNQTKSISSDCWRIRLSIEAQLVENKSVQVQSQDRCDLSTSFPATLNRAGYLGVTFEG